MTLKRSLLVVSAALAFASCVDPRGASSAAEDAASGIGSDSSFARLIEALSEPGGYFDTDNLISNETSYLHVIGKLEELGISGGAYIGVGPDQNFSYVATLRPQIALIIDIRRDNQLQHLMFKALFALSRNRIEYLCRLFGRPVPDDGRRWEGRDIEELVDYIDVTPIDSKEMQASLSSVAEVAASFGVRLSEGDLETIRRFHSTFMRDGLSLRFRSHGRRPRPYYPTYRQLLLETDLEGRRASYLANESDFQFVKQMQARHLILPVVGDLAGYQAMRAIARYLKEKKLPVTAFYTSNVEFYLMRSRSFESFADNVAALPFDENSVIIRSYFGRNFGYGHPQAVPGYYSVQLLQPIRRLVEDQRNGGYRSYFDLVTRGSLELESANRP